MRDTISRVFAEPDWTKPIDFAARLAVIPPQATVRGMFLQLLQDNLPAEVTGPARARRYVGFKTYPMREYVELLAAACTRSRQGLANGECVRRLGRGVYPSYAKTVTGTAIFAAAGRNFRRALELCPAAYRISTPTASVTVVDCAPGRARVSLRGLYNLPDLHQVGIFEGAMQVCGAEGTILVQCHDDLGDVDFDVRWRDARSSVMTHSLR